LENKTVTMVNKKLLKRMFSISEARVQGKEKRFEKAIKNIEKAETEFKKTTDELNEQLKVEGQRVYEGPMDDIMTMVQWLETQHTNEVKIREEIKEVKKRVEKNSEFCVRNM